MLQDGQDCSLGRPGGAPGAQQASQQTNRGERWEGEGRLLMLSRQVIQAEGPSMVMGEDIRGQTSLILTYHRHMFGLGEHYNSVAVL